MQGYTHIRNAHPGRQRPYYPFEATACNYYAKTPRISANRGSNGIGAKLFEISTAGVRFGALEPWVYPE